jgi:hypothetical protein
MLKTAMLVPDAVDGVPTRPELYMSIYTTCSLQV